ncbi:MAG: hypothetical protein ABEI78_00655 [Candidatus Nanohaloarchaea archaeon]
MKKVASVIIILIFLSGTVAGLTLNINIDLFELGGKNNDTDKTANKSKKNTQKYEDKKRDRKLDNSNPISKEKNKKGLQSTIKSIKNFIDGLF